MCILLGNDILQVGKCTSVLGDNEWPIRSLYSK